MRNRSVVDALKESDSELLHRIKDMDEAEIDELVSTCNAMVGVIDENDIEEMKKILENAVSGELSRQVVLKWIKKASQTFNLEMITLLIEYGVDSSHPDFPNIPVTFAEHVTPDTFGDGRRFVTALLKYCDFSINIDQPRSTDGATGLCIAVDRAMPPVVQMFIAMGADVNMVTSRGLTPMIYCSLARKAATRRMIASQSQQPHVKLNDPKTERLGFTFEVNHSQPVKDSRDSSLPKEERVAGGGSHPTLQVDEDGVWRRSDFEILQTCRVVADILKRSGGFEGGREEKEIFELEVKEAAQAIITGSARGLSTGKGTPEISSVPEVVESTHQGVTIISPLPPKEKPKLVSTMCGPSKFQRTIVPEEETSKYFKREDTVNSSSVLPTVDVAFSAVTRPMTTSTPSTRPQLQVTSTEMAISLDLSPAACDGPLVLSREVDPATGVVTTEVEVSAAQMAKAELLLQRMEETQKRQLEELRLRFLAQQQNEETEVDV